ncbi:MAG: bacillithiol system redox-active protein YtxJ [Calditrichia bacterium]
MKFIFKHSTRCPISARAKSEVELILPSLPENLEYIYVDVIANRTESNRIAEHYGIRHESPQVLLIDDNDQVFYHASHYQIKADTLKEKIATL